MSSGLHFSQDLVYFNHDRFLVVSRGGASHQRLGVTSASRISLVKSYLFEIAPLNVYGKVIKVW